MNEAEIISRVQGLYPDAKIDVAGADCSFELIIVDPAFEGMGTLQRQKPILALFREEITSGKLHALSVRVQTPGELQSSSGLVQLRH